MKPGLRQATLTILFLAAIGLIGSHPPPVPAGSGSEGATPTATSTGSFLAPEMEPVAMASAPPTTISPRSMARPLSVVVYPSEAEAELTVTDGAGSTTVTGTFDGQLTGELTLEVAADGYRPESHVIPGERTGTYEVFLDPADQLVDRTMALVTGAAPKQVAFTPDARELWVTLLAGSGVEVYDPATGERLAEIDLPEAGSVEVIFDSAGETAWVSQMETARVYEIDVATRQVRRHLDTGGSWTKVIALSPDGTRLWASNWVSNDVTEFDLKTGEIVRRLPTVTTPRGLATDAAGERLYVAGYDSGEIQMIDLERGEGQVIHTSGGAMRHLVRDPSGGHIYASDMARDVVLEIDPATDEVTEFSATERLPNTIDISPDGNVLAVSNRGANNSGSYHLPGPEWGSILLFDTAGGKLLDAVVAGNQPTGLDVSADGEWLAYSDFLDNRVTVVALPSLPELKAGDGGRSDTYRPELRK